MTTNFPGLPATAKVAGAPAAALRPQQADVRLRDNLLPHLRGFRTIAFDPPGIAPDITSFLTGGRQARDGPGGLPLAS